MNSTVLCIQLIICIIIIFIYFYVKGKVLFINSMQIVLGLYASLNNRQDLFGPRIAGHNNKKTISSG